MTLSCKAQYCLLYTEEEAKIDCLTSEGCTLDEIQTDGGKKVLVMLYNTFNMYCYFSNGYVILKDNIQVINQDCIKCKVYETNKRTKKRCYNKRML